MLTRLADILVIQAIRFWLATAPEAKQGWLAAARNEHIGQALSAIHRRPYGWRDLPEHLGDCQAVKRRYYR